MRAVIDPEACEDADCDGNYSNDLNKLHEREIRYNLRCCSTTSAPRILEADTSEM